MLFLNQNILKQIKLYATHLHNTVFIINPLQFPTETETNSIMDVPLFMHKKNVDNLTTNIHQNINSNWIQTEFALKGFVCSREMVVSINNFPRICFYLGKLLK
jgi:hypothetical protein